MRKCKEIKEFYEVNDLVICKEGLKIVPKREPRLIGWSCNCGFVTTIWSDCYNHMVENKIVKEQKK